MRRIASLSLFSRYKAPAACVASVATIVSRPPPPTAAVIVPSAPEFEGEAGPAPPRTAPPAPAGSPPPRASMPTRSVIDVRKLLSGVQGPTPPGLDSDTRRVKEAYMKYFDHIRFRNGWAQPAFKKEDVDHLLDEAAYFVVRIRIYLDRKSKGEARLRQLDGEAQKFLHTEQAPLLLKKDPRRFMLAVVDATFQDARGYVEGLTRATLLQIVGELAQYQYNPRIHALHLAARLEDLLNKSPLAAEADILTDEQAAVKENTFYVADGSPADEKWRECIRKFYGLIDEFDAALKAKSDK